MARKRMPPNDATPGAPAPAGAPRATVSVPVIADPQAYLADALAGWRRGCERLGLAL